MASQAAPVGVGVIGLGMASKPHLEALAQLQGIAQVRGVYSPTQESREQVAAEHGLAPAASIDELVSDKAVEAVLVLTPPNARADIVAACCAAGKDILLEKPIERTIAAAERIIASCAAAKVRLGVVLQHRFRSDVRQLADLLEAGELGDIAAVRLNFPWWRPQSYYDHAGRGTYERDGGGVLISQAIHVLDVMLQLAGPVEEVSAFKATTALHEMESEDFAVAGLRFSSGAVGSVVATTAAYPGQTEELTVECTKGSARLHANILTVSWHDGRTATYGEERGTGAGADPMAFGPELHRELIEDFLAGRSAGRDPAVTGASALQVQQLIEAMVVSSDAGGRIAIAQERQR